MANQIGLEFREENQARLKRFLEKRVQIIYSQAGDNLGKQLLHFHMSANCGILLLEETANNAEQMDCLVLNTGARQLQKTVIITNLKDRIMDIVNHLGTKILPKYPV